MNENQDLLEIISFLEELDKSGLYDVNKFLCSTKHLVSQLHYFYCHLVSSQTGEPDNTYYYLPSHPSTHQLAYFNIGRGFPKELMDGHWCYVVKDLGYKMLVIPCTSVKEDSQPCNELFEKDIIVKMQRRKVVSRLQLSDMRYVDSQRLDLRKRFCHVLTPRSEIMDFMKEHIFSDE